MRRCVTAWYISALTAVLVTASLAQKVNFGYDRSAEFSKYKTYTWAEPVMPPVRPLLYQNIVGAIDNELKSKGFMRADNDGDLVLICDGGIGFGINAAAGTPILSTYSGAPLTFDATMWTGTGGGSNSMVTSVPEGTLLAEFVDRRTNKVVWQGTVTTKLDIEKKNDSLRRIDKAIQKLFNVFPPRKA